MLTLVIHSQLGIMEDNNQNETFKAEFNSKVNAPHALTNSIIGSSFTIKGTTLDVLEILIEKLLGLPNVSWSAPGQASKKRKVPLTTISACKLAALYPNSFSSVVGSGPTTQIGRVYLGTAGEFGKILKPHCIRYPVKTYRNTVAVPTDNQTYCYLLGFPQHSKNHYNKT